MFMYNLFFFIFLSIIISNTCCGYHLNKSQEVIQYPLGFFEFWVAVDDSFYPIQDAEYLIRRIPRVPVFGRQEKEGEQRSNSSRNGV